MKKQILPSFRHHSSAIHHRRTHILAKLTSAIYSHCPSTITRRLLSRWFPRVSSIAKGWHKRSPTSTERQPQNPTNPAAAYLPGSGIKWKAINKTLTANKNAFKKISAAPWISMQRILAVAHPATRGDASYSFFHYLFIFFIFIFWKHIKLFCFCLLCNA